jgi:hypothetical protein
MGTAVPSHFEIYDAGMRVWIGDELNGINAETVINRTAAARLKWPEGFTAASWLHETGATSVPRQPICQRAQRLTGKPVHCASSWLASFSSCLVGRVAHTAKD